MTNSTGVEWGTTTHTDKHGVTREYKLVYRHAKVGELAMVEHKKHVFTVTGVSDMGVTGHGLWNGNLWHCNYAVLEPTDIVIHKGQRYREVSRKARKGELIMITETVGGIMDAIYKVGDVATVLEVDETCVKINLVNGCAWVGHTPANGNRYVVLEPVNEPELSLHDIVRDLKRIAEDYRQLTGRVDALEAKQSESTNQVTHDRVIPIPYTRDQVVDKAKADMWRWSANGEFNVFTTPRQRIPYSCRADFVIDRKKRTVVCLMRGCGTGNVYARGIAKCAPDDCFNVHIGKAIALRRALRKEVPDYYVNAPQPTEPAIGDVIMWPHVSAVYHVVKPKNVERNLKIVKPTCLSLSSAHGGAFAGCVILDDSHDFGGEQ